MDEFNRTGNPSDQKALLMLRIIWAALLAGQIVFAPFVIFFRESSAEESFAKMMFFVAAGMLIAAVPTAYAVRAAMYRAARFGSVVPMSAYATGNIIFLAMLEGASFFGLVVILITGRIVPAIVVPILAVIVQLLNFPSGGPTRETH